MADIMQALRDKGWKGKTLALRMGVCGDGKIRRVTSYDAADPDSVARSVTAMRVLGIEGVVHIWNGPGGNHGHRSMMNCWRECERQGMSFAIMLDQWVAKDKDDPTGATVAALNDIDFRRVLQSRAYLPEWYVLEFSLAGAAHVDVAEVQRRCPRLKILSRNRGYSWVAPYVPGLAAANAGPLMKIPGVCLYFNDGGYPLPSGVNTPEEKYTGRDWSRSVWGAHGTDAQSKPDVTARVYEHQGGHWFMDQIAVTPITAKYVMLATWDDYEEGTGIEFFAAALAGVRI